jgi:hypothetical protein
MQRNGRQATRYPLKAKYAVLSYPIWLVFPRDDNGLGHTLPDTHFTARPLLNLLSRDDKKT